MAKYYAVAKGKSGIPMILDSWAKCQAEVIGCKGAIYKSFTSKEEAEKFIKLNLGEVCDDEEESCNNDIIRIYVDGSFIESKQNYSYGFVIVKNDEIIYEEKGKGQDKEALAHRNIAGEVLAVEKAVEYCIKNDIKEVNIYHDYQGLSCWALGTWNRNTKLTQEYHNYMKNNMEIIKINFIKVKGHSGDKYNDIADKLAKEALEDM